MVEQPALNIPVERHKSHGRQLHGARLFLARGAYLVLFALVLTFFLVGLPSYIASWNQGSIGGLVRQDAGEILIISSIRLATPPGQVSKMGTY